MRSLPVSSPASPFITDRTTMRLATPTAIPVADKMATQRVNALCSELKLSLRAMSNSIGKGLTSQRDRKPRRLSQVALRCRFQLREAVIASTGERVSVSQRCGSPPHISQD